MQCLDIDHSGPIWGVRGGIGPKGARGLVLVSIPRVLGMGNSLGPFSATSDWPKWPKWPFSAIYGHSNGQIGNYGSEHARNVFLVSIPRLLGMGNLLGPFSATSDWPK